jgi:hypothetical protein
MNRWQSSAAIRFSLSLKSAKLGLCHHRIVEGDLVRPDVALNLGHRPRRVNDDGLVSLGRLERLDRGQGLVGEDRGLTGGPGDRRR